MLRRALQCVVGATFELIDPCLIDIEAERFKFFAEFNGKRQANIPESYDPDNGFFVLDFLNKKQVLFVYGSGFGPEYGAGHFRVVYLAPIPMLEDAFDKLEDFMKK